MKLTATDFRMNLFPTLEAASTGEDVTITHKGRTFKLKMESTRTRMERLAEITPLPGFEGSDELAPDYTPWDEQAWMDKWTEQVGS